MAAVEAREVVSYPRHHAAFCQTEEKSTCQKTLVVFNECGAHRDDSESNDEEWKVETAANNLQYDIRWDFDGDVGGVEDGKGQIESKSSQIEFLCHTLDTRVATSRQLYSGKGMSQLEYPILALLIVCQYPIEAWFKCVLPVNEAQQIQHEHCRDNAPIHPLSDTLLIQFVPFH